jgi:predicted aspartyl protease
MRMAGSLTLLLLTSVPALADPICGAPRGTLPVELLADGSIVVPVIINGAGPFRFLLDTGSTRSGVAEPLAMRLRLPHRGHSLLITPTGRHTRPLAHVERLAIGDAFGTSITAVVLPHADFGERTGLDGLIGQDLLAPLVYTIDYARREIVWNPDAEAHDHRAKLPLETGEGRLLVKLPQGSAGGWMLRMVPDTGADGLVLFATPSGTRLDITLMEVAVLRTVAGHRLGRRVLVDKLSVGDVVLRDHNALLVPRDDAGALGDGLLPLHLFSRVTFNGPGGYVVVEGQRQLGNSRR